jgi:endonuclease G
MKVAVIRTSLCLGAILAMSAAANAQDTVLVKHTYYESTWIESAHIPCLVEYMLTADMLSCDNKLPRQSGFTADPDMTGTNLKRDYDHSGYDCGHNMSAEDNACNKTGEHECFYYTNMFPQSGHLNRGIWKKLEAQERKYATKEGQIEVFIGSIGKLETIGPDKVFAPKYCWKAIYHFNSKLWEVYCFPNDETAGGEFADYRPTAKQLERIKYVINHYSKFQIK